MRPRARRKSQRGRRRLRSPCWGSKSQRRMKEGRRSMGAACVQCSIYRRERAREQSALTLYRAAMGRSNAAAPTVFASFARFGESTLWRGCVETRMRDEEHGPLTEWGIRGDREHENSSAGGDERFDRLVLLAKFRFA